MSTKENDGHWRTIDGTHVFIKGGVITKGPAALTGKKPSELPAHQALHEKLGDSEASYHGAKAAESAKPSPASSGKAAANKAAGISTGLFGQTVMDKATGSKQGTLFDTTKPAPVSEPIKGSKSALDPKNTGKLFGATEAGKAAADKAAGITASDTPREAAAKVTEKMMQTDYAYARPSSVGNVGEDLANSARHKRNAWRGLAEAEASGTAAQLVTRDKLLENEPHKLMDAVEKNPQTALAMHYAMKSFPPKPGYGKVASDAKTQIKDRQQFLDTYRQFKAKAEDLAATESNPMTAVEKMRNWTSAKLLELRGAKGPDTVSQAMATDRHNSTANALVGTYKDLSVFRPNKTSVMGKMNDFAKAGTNKYGLDIGTKPGTPEAIAAAKEKLDKINSHVRDLIGGTPLATSFGMEKAGATGAVAKFNPASMYIGKPVRTGGRDISTVTKDANVATSHLVDAFKMRGVQWGNSVTDDERMHHAAHVVGALTDLAEVTGLKPEDISLSGKLGLAIGARGHGGASAHYEPGSKVINLTRESGVGTLAHEWGHAFDHELAGGNITSDGTRSSGDYQSGRMGEQRFVRAAPGEPSVRGYKVDEKGKMFTQDVSQEPVFKAMKDVRTAMESSGYNKRLSGALSEIEHNPKMSLYKDRKYWTSPPEKFARTFERYVQHKLNERGSKNTYLSGFSGDLNQSSHGDLWPNAHESAHMAPAVDSLIAAYRQRKYGSPAPQTFSRRSAQKTISRLLSVA